MKNRMKSKTLLLIAVAHIFFVAASVLYAAPSNFTEGDLKLFYGNVVIDAAAETQETFMNKVKGGRFEKSNGNYWWDDGASFWTNGKLNWIQLENKAKTPRGIQTGSPISQIFKVYPGNYEKKDISVSGNGEGPFAYKYSFTIKGVNYYLTFAADKSGKVRTIHIGKE